MTESIYQFKATSLNGETISLDKFRGKNILIVNTASKCGFTPQYEGLQKLFEKYYEQNLVILGFPCNQFGKQEPDNEKSIAANCLVNYGVSFPMFAKVNVNGEDAHPLFKYLKKEIGGIPTKSIKWNFTKFLINKKGKPVKRFAPFTTPGKIEKYLKKEFYIT